MKTKFALIGLAAVLLAGIVSGGCASAHDESKNTHRRENYGAILPPGYTAVIPNISNNPTSNEVTGFSVIAPSGSAAPGFFASLFVRPHVFLAYRETWEDKSKGGGTFVLTDPQASQLSFTRENQNALGGNRSVLIGDIRSVITTNAVGIVTATGTAVGNVVGAAASAAAK